MHQIKWHGIDFIEREQNERRKKRLLRWHQAICCKLFMILQRYFCRGGIFYIIFVAETIDFRFRISNAISNWQSHEPQIQTKQSAQNDMEDTKGVRRLGSFSLKEQQCEVKNTYFHFIKYIVFAVMFMKFMWCFDGGDCHSLAFFINSKWIRQKMSTASNIKFRIDYVAHACRRQDDSQRMRQQMFSSVVAHS